MQADWHRGPVTNGRWNTESPWHVVRVQLLKLSLVVSRNGTQVDINALWVQHTKHFRGSGKCYLLLLGVVGD